MRIRRAAARTFTSKYVRHCSSVISRAGTAPKMPRLFTRMSTSASSRCSSAAPSSVVTSTATPMASPLNFATASSTRSGVRPFTATRAPPSASPWAMAKPMPCVDPVTRAVFRSDQYSRPATTTGRCRLFLSLPDSRLFVVSADSRLFVVSADGNVAQLALEDLSSRVARQFVEEDHLARHLIAGQMLFDVGLDVVLADTGAVGLDHERAQPVPPLLVLHAHRGGLDDVGMTADQILHLGGKHVLAARHDHFVVATADVQQAVLVEIADIAGRHEPVDDLLVSPAGVALERKGIADEDPADLTLRKLVAAVVKDLDLDALDHRAHRRRVLLQVLGPGDSGERDFR